MRSTITFSNLNSSKQKFSESFENNNHLNVFSREQEKFYNNLL